MLVLFYFICKTGYPPEYALAVFPFVRFLLLPIFLMLAKKLINLSIRFFAKKVILPIVFVSIVSFLPFYFANKLFSESILRFCVVLTSSMLWTSLVIMFCGLRRSERIKVVDFLKRKIGGGRLK
jgi:hypothetical protein